MLEALGTFATSHPYMGAFVLFFAFVIVTKLERLADRAIDARSDSEREYRRERRERIEGRTA